MSHNVSTWDSNSSFLHASWTAWPIFITPEILALVYDDDDYDDDDYDDDDDDSFGLDFRFL